MKYLRIAYLILILLVLVALTGIGYAIYVKGIHIHNTYNQQQYQNQQQAQLLLGAFGSKGNLKWIKKTCKEIEKENHLSTMSFLNTLSPEQSLFAKIVSTDVNCYVLIPSITE